jgi:hypothetical protein
MKLKRPVVTLALLCALVTPSLLFALVVPVSAGPLSNFYESPIPYWDDHSGDAVSVCWSGTNQTITLAGGDASSNLSIGVPVMRGDSQRIAVMMSVANLSSTVRFDFSDDGVATGQYADVNGTHVVFRDGSDGDLTDEVVLDFFVWDSRNRFWIQAYDDSGIIARWDSWYGLAGNSWFNMTSSNFNGTLELFYLEGDTDYRTIYTVPEWEVDVVDSSTDVTVSPMGVSADITSMDDAFYYGFNLSVPYWNYLRTRTSLVVIGDQGYPDANVWEVGSAVFLYLYLLNGSPAYHVMYLVEYEYYYNVATESKVSCILWVYDVLNDEYIYIVWGVDDVDDDGVVGLDYEFQFAAWRTQEDHLGVYVESPYADMTDSPGNMTEANEFVWTSEVNDASNGYDIDWSGVELEIVHYGQAAERGYQMYQLVMPQFEYSYFRDAGVVQPHFSSVWWSGDGSGWGGQYVVIEEDVYNLHGTDQDATDIDPFDPWRWLVDTLSAVFGSIFGVFTGVLIAIPMLGAGLVALIINLFVPGGGPAFFGVLTDIGVGIGGIFGLVSFLFDLFGMIIGHVTFWVNWFFTYILTAENMLWIGLGLLAIPILIARMWGVEAAVDFVKTYYVGGVIAIFKAVYTIIMGVLNLIAGFLPGT